MLKVADFFCGAGGFSEGFRQIGFELAYALDSWEPAIQTVRLYHPRCKFELADIRNLDSSRKIEESVPDVDVIIGSPPCVSFSYSNRAGKADKSLGLELILAFLRIVACKKKKGSLKYWIMENVPNAAKYVKDEYTWKELGLSGQGPSLQIPQKNVFNAMNFGVPQARERFFAGDYPVPNKTHTKETHLTVRDVFDALGNPLSSCSDGWVTDPNYPVRIRTSELTDHFYDTRIEEWKWKPSKRLKKDHGYMGRMAFPDKLDRPSRTVIAKGVCASREAMIFGAEKGDDGQHKSYRLPTIREIACFMSFPITYQFNGNTESSKRRLVGNAVACKQARALAEAILRKEGVDAPNFIAPPKAKPSKDLTGFLRKMTPPPRRRKNARFVMHIPHLKEGGFRVELTNRHSDFNTSKVVWSVELHKGIGKGSRRWECGFKTARRLFIASRTDTKLELQSKPDYASRVDTFKEELKERFETRLPDAETFQQIYTRRVKTEHIEPDEALGIIRNLIDKYFPKHIFKSSKIKNGNIPRLKPEEFPVRIVAGLFACEYVALSVNNS